MKLALCFELSECLVHLLPRLVKVVQVLLVVAALPQGDSVEPVVFIFRVLFKLIVLLFKRFQVEAVVLLVRLLQSHLEVG